MYEPTEAVAALAWLATCFVAGLLLGRLIRGDNDTDEDD